MNLGEKDILHPVASSFDRNNVPDIVLVYDPKDRPNKKRLSRSTGVGRPDVGKAPAATDKQASENIDMAYHGLRKPALVLAFQDHGTRFVSMIGEARRLTIINTRRDFWKCFIEQKEARYSRREKKLVFRWVQFMSGIEAEGAARALDLFIKRDGWFFYEGAWRSLAWVYRSVITIGLGSFNAIPKERPATKTKPAVKNERGLRAGHNLPHIKGYWRWELEQLRIDDSAAALIKPLIRLPDNTGLSRMPKNPDLRGELSYIQDMVDAPQKRKRVGNGWVIKYEGRKSWTNKDPNPIKPPRDNAWDKSKTSSEAF